MVTARLILLNGPPGIGKSTLSRRYGAAHPGVLDLDVDRLRGFIGGWEDRFSETGEIVRPLGLALAATHLRGGRDVVLPQYLGDLGEVARFERVAHEAGGGATVGRGGLADRAPAVRRTRPVVGRLEGTGLTAALTDPASGRSAGAR